MKHFLITTAFATLIAAPVLAQTTPVEETPAGIFRTTGSADDLHASGFIGRTVYAAETEVHDTVLTEASAEWQNVGRIGDVLLSKTGAVEAILVDVGGFLGIGTRTVAVDMDALRLISDGDDHDDYFVVFTANRAALENAPEYTAWKPMETSATPASGWMTPDEGYALADRDSLTADALKKANVYDANNAHVASISDLVLAADGKIDKAIIDVGGFLGIGTRSVAVDFDDLEIHQSRNDQSYRVYLNLTKEALESLPEFKG